MKNRNILYFILLFTWVYIISMFIAGEYNPLKWHGFLRFASAIVLIVGYQDRYKN